MIYHRVFSGIVQSLSPGLDPGTSPETSIEIASGNTPVIHAGVNLVIPPGLL